MPSRFHTAYRTAAPELAGSLGPTGSTADVVHVLLLLRWERPCPLPDSMCSESSNNCTNNSGTGTETTISFLHSFA